MSMIKQINIGIGVLVVAFITSGCVSTSTFEKMQAGKNEEIKTRQQHQTALEQDRDDADRPELGRRVEQVN